MTDVDLNVKGLEKLLKALKAKPPVARVGILGDNARSGDGELTNAEVGAFAEFGTSRSPVRSFLRLPLTALLDKELGKAGAFSKEALNEVIALGSIIPWLQKVAITAEAIVLGAFDTGGYGVWPPSDMRHKQNHQTLVETGQLRNSITSEVRE